MNLSTISIRTQLLALAGGLALMMMLVGLLGLSHHKSANAEFESVYKDRVVPLKQLKVAADMYAVNIVDTTHKVRNQNIPWGDGLRNIDDARAQLDREWKAYMSTYMDEEEKKLAGEAGMLMTTADQQVQRLKSIMQAQNAEALADFATHDLYPAIDPISNKISELVTLQLDRAQKGFENAQAAYIEARNMAIALLAIALLAGTAISLVIVGGIVAPLAQATEAAQRIARGDLTRPVEVSGSNETGRLLSAIREMQQKLGQMVTHINRSVEQVTSSAQQLAAASQQVSSSSEQQSEATAAVAAAVEELTTSIEQVSGNAEDAEHKAAESGSLSQLGARQVHEATEEMSRIATSVGETAAQMGNLGEQAQQISRIADVIKDVADQTNLLALNAAIEAARAGEQGRGFAVVADEVRKLAERTTSSAKEITVMISSIQEHTSQATASMNIGNKRVVEGVALAELAGDSMRQISASLSGVVHAVTDIASALSEQKIASSEIARNVEQISHMTEENSMAVAEVASAAERLKSLATELDQSVAEFRT